MAILGLLSGCLFRLRVLDSGLATIVRHWRFDFRPLTFRLGLAGGAGTLRVLLIVLVLLLLLGELQQVTERTQVLLALFHLLGNGDDRLRSALFVSARALRSLFFAAATAISPVSLGLGSAARRELLSFARIARRPFAHLLARCRGRFGRRTLASTRSALLLLWSRLLCAGLDHRERHAASILINRRNPHANLVPHRDHVVRVAYVTRTQLADVNEPAIGEANVNKRTKVDDVQHR